jgi:hypothetical protein
MSVEAADMARKRAPKAPPSPSGEPGGERPVAIQVRGWPAWKEWVVRLAQFEAKRLSVAVNLNALVGRALIYYARSIGFPEEPPER